MDQFIYGSVQDLIPFEKYTNDLHLILWDFILRYPFVKRITVVFGKCVFFFRMKKIAEIERVPNAIAGYKA